MKFNSEINHPYRNIVEYLNITEEANLIDDFLHYISVIEFNEETTASKNKIILKDTDLREQSQIMDVYDFINLLTHRYIDAIKIILLNNNISRTEIFIRLGEFRERVIEHWQFYTETELSPLKKQFTTEEINPAHIRNMKARILMEHRLPEDGMLTKREQSLEHLCAFYFEEDKASTFPKDKRSDGTEKYHQFNSNFLPEMKQILTPIDNLDYLGFLHVPNDPTTHIGEDSTFTKGLPYLNTMISDITSDIQNKINKEVKQVNDQRTLYKDAQTKLDKLKMFPDLITRRDYLLLDNEYNSKKTTMEKGEYIKKTAAFSKHRKRDYKVVQRTSFTNWKKTADYKKSDNKPVGHANGILTLCYWRLYYYNTNLFEDLKKLEAESDHDTFIHLMRDYYTFIKEDLLIEVVELIVEEYDSVKSVIREELHEVNEDINMAMDTRKRTPLIKKQDRLLSESQRYNQSSSLIGNYCKDIIKIHFNHSFVEQILKIYTTSSIQHKLMLETYENEDKVMELL